VPCVDAWGVECRVKKVQTRSLKGETKLSALQLAVSMLDMTTLEGADSAGKVRQLCMHAMRPDSDDPSVGPAAAVCVYPTWVGEAKQFLQARGSNIQVASVATAFPSGQLPLDLRLAEVKYAVEQGANEIDMVISRGRFLAGDYQAVFDEVAACKEACGQAHLKVILEVGELATYDNVRYASEIAMGAGADFIKTSTGKVQPASSLQVTYVMLQAIKDYHQRTGKMVGMKPAGGISKAKLALQYLVLVKEVLGADWLTPQWFRFGASSLALDLVRQIHKQKHGYYPAIDQFSRG